MSFHIAYFAIGLLIGFAFGVLYCRNREAKGRYEEMHKEFLAQKARVEAFIDFPNRNNLKK